MSNLIAPGIYEMSVVLNHDHAISEAVFTGIYC